VTGVSELGTALSDLQLAGAAPAQLVDLLDVLRSLERDALSQLEDHASLVPTLAPLLGHPEASLRSAAAALLERIVVVAASPRELFLAMCGALAHVGDAEDDDEADERLFVDELVAWLGLIGSRASVQRSKRG